MKKLLVVLLTVVTLSGCSGKGDSLNQPLELRKSLLAGNGCRFNATVTADYGDVLYTFSMVCQSDPQGSLQFQVSEPESIAGISGSVSQEGGKLTFSDQALVFSTIADGLLTPVSAPWIFVKALRGGYINSCGTDGAYQRISIDDSYEENALRLDIWMDQDRIPVRGEILWKNRRVLSLDITDFQIL